MKMFQEVPTYLKSGRIATINGRIRRQKAGSSLVCQWEQKKGKSSLEADSDITVVTWIGGKPSWSNKARSKRNMISWELFLSVLHFIFKHIGSNEALKRLFLNKGFHKILLKC